MPSRAVKSLGERCSGASSGAFPQIRADTGLLQVRNSIAHGTRARSAASGESRGSAVGCDT
jgi:hypothetical protein